MTDPAAPDDALVYAYRPSVLGAAWQFTLRPDAIEWNTGRRSGRVRYADVRMIRMSFRPVTMQPMRFITEVVAQGAPKLDIVSTSWKSMVEQQRLDQAYSAFVTELHHRVAAAGAPVRYQQGGNAILYWAGFAAFAAVGLGLAALIARALQAQAWGGAAFIAAFLAIFLWQAGNYFRRNRPGIYRPDALPAGLMPKP